MLRGKSFGLPLDVSSGGDMGHTKTAAFRTRPTATAAVLAALYGFMPPAHAGVLPNGGHFVAGSGSIGGTANSMTIDQTTSRGVIDWNSFSIGSGSRVAFHNGNGATLNRVTGGDASAIYGTLSATGSVYLVNPQGILIGPKGEVTT